MTMNGGAVDHSGWCALFHFTCAHPAPYAAPFLLSDQPVASTFANDDVEIYTLIADLEEMNTAEPSDIGSLLPGFYPLGHGVLARPTRAWPHLDLRPLGEGHRHVLHPRVAEQRLQPSLPPEAALLVAPEGHASILGQAIAIDVDEAGLHTVGQLQGY